jgi:nucleoside-diphosphate-sugar epimerase
MRRVLVTGGTGFVGANLVRRLLADGHAVSLLLRPQSDDWRLREVLAECRCLTARLDDDDAVASVFRDVMPEWVFHLAAYGNSSWHTDLGAILAANVTATHGLLLAAREAGVERFIHTGSSSEYGRKDHPAREDERIDPDSLYAITKAAATHLCRMAAANGLPTITLRLYNVYGPYEEPRRLIPALVLHGLEGRLPPLVNPQVARDLVHVDDVVEALLCAAAVPRADGAIYNIGTGVMLQLADVVGVVRRVMGIAEEPRWGTMPDRSWDTAVWVADTERARRDLGWSASLTFEDGLRQTVDWFLQNPDLEAYYRKTHQRAAAPGP